MNIEQYHAHQAKLQALGDHWHRKLHHGSGPWEGDRFLFLYSNALTDEIELRYEIPNQPSQLVFKVTLGDFDIDKLCARLAVADNRKTSVQDKINAADAANARMLEAKAKVDADRKEAAAEKMVWAIRKDTGHHIAPMIVPEKVSR